MRGEDSDAQLHTTAGGGHNTVGSGSQFQHPNIRHWYECSKHVHSAINWPLFSLGTQVHTQSTREPGYSAVTPCKTSQVDENTDMQMKQFYLSAALKATQILMESTHSSVNSSLSIITDGLLGFDTGFNMCQYGRLLVNSVCSGKAFIITNVGDTCTWIFLDIHSMINFFWNRKLLTDMEHMEVSMAIHCNTGIVHTSFSGVIPGD